MQLSPTEMWAIREMARQLAMSVEKTGFYLQQVQDPALQRLLVEHQECCWDHYHAFVAQIAQGQAQMPQLPQPPQAPQGWGMPSASHAGAHERWQPNPRPSRVEDRIIAADGLYDTKGAAVLATYLTLEIAHKPLRRQFQQLIQDYLDLSFEYYRFLHQKGMYSLPRTAQDMSQMLQQAFVPGGDGQGSAPDNAWTRARSASQGETPRDYAPPQARS
ncbi:MAG: spore coat protein [Clostridiales bacterium]|nr:spore coat protein [Clostridiales bacterium]